MATFGALTQGDLPPVGNPISLLNRSVGPGFDAPFHFPGYRAVMVGSGTMALALAMIMIKARCSHIDRPEVILPGYGCPDLVSAAVYAGLQPVLVDIEENYHGYNLTCLANAVSESTVAVIAVNFLGIPERLSDIRQLLEPFPSVYLIEDNAQWFPELRDGESLSGDYICLSFGRGKPVSLLGGGALLIRNSLDEREGSIEKLGAQRESEFLLQLKIAAYNRLLHPFVYQFLSRNRFLHLGQTVYKPLSTISSMDDFRLSLLKTNIKNYRGRDRSIEGAVAKLVERASKYEFVNLADTERRPDRRLLRYPLLCSNEDMRREIIRTCMADGLGVSSMYGRSLEEIPGVSERVTKRGSLSAANYFAGRLLTLPLHSGVKQMHLDKLVNLL